METFGLEQMTDRERVTGVGPVENHSDGPGGIEVCIYPITYHISNYSYYQIHTNILILLTVHILIIFTNFTNILKE